MDIFDKLDELVEAKRNNKLSDEESEKLKVIENLFIDKSCFFEMEAETAFGILEFLGMEEDDAIDLYFDLTSPEMYDKTIPKVRSGKN